MPVILNATARAAGRLGLREPAHGAGVAAAASPVPPPALAAVASAVAPCGAARPPRHARLGSLHAYAPLPSLRAAAISRGAALRASASGSPSSPAQAAMAPSLSLDALAEDELPELRRLYDLNNTEPKQVRRDGWQRPLCPAAGGGREEGTHGRGGAQREESSVENGRERIGAPPGAHARGARPHGAAPTRRERGEWAQRVLLIQNLGLSRHASAPAPRGCIRGDGRCAPSTPNLRPVEVAVETVATKTLADRAAAPAAPPRSLRRSWPRKACRCWPSRPARAACRAAARRRWTRLRSTQTCRER
eukprot:361427-Chlamydomonas_euryale.AAC.7